VKRFSSRLRNRISNNVRDGVATPEEVQIFEALAAEDREFVALESEMDNAMAFLRSGQLESEMSEDFEGRLMRRWRMESRRRSIAYWTPAIAGGLVAAACLLTVLQLLMNGPQIQNVNLQGQEAKLEGPSDPAFSTFKDTASPIQK